MIEIITKIKLIDINLQLFADVTNATTSNSSGNNLSAEMKTFYDNSLIDLVEPLLVHDKFAQKRPIPKNAGKTSAQTVGNGEPGPCIRELCAHLLDIQFGRAEDRHGWLRRVV